MKPSIRTLSEILYSPSQYVIPVFQRNYRWDRQQWERLWSSITEMRSPRKVGNHFMGFLVFVPGLAQPGQHTRFHMVDGQQRLTTSSILLTALRNVARELNQPELADEINQSYLVHPHRRGDESYRLMPKEQDRENYKAMVTGEGEPIGRMADALDYFEERFKAEAETSVSSLRASLDLVTQRLEFMCATLETENAYNIFKSLNSTGVPLGPADLIRNFIFMHVKPDDQAEFDTELWAPLESHFQNPDGRLDEPRFSGFFRDVLMMEGSYVAPKETFSVFESKYEATGFSPVELARQLLTHAQRHLVISGARPDSSQDVTRALTGLNVLDSSTTYPLLLQLFKQRASATLDDAALARCVDMLRGFILRRYICAESSRGYGQMFLRAVKPAGSDPEQALETYLLERGWPDDEKFRTAFAEFPLYQRAYAKDVLEAVERSHGHKEPAALATAQIEHIMPVTLNDTWRRDLGEDWQRVHTSRLHRPGNLTLSGYNPELWNHPFAVKREEYRNSNIVITRKLADETRWRDDEIDARGRLLADKAVTIWQGPAVAYVPPASNETVLPEGKHRLKFWTGLVDHLADTPAELPQIEARDSSSLRLQSGIRHIGFEVRHQVRPASEAIDIYFWRGASLPVWEKLRADHAVYDELMGAAWTFDRRDDGRAWMTLEIPTQAGEPHWPTAYEWYADKLMVLYSAIAVRLREEMAAQSTSR